MPPELSADALAALRAATLPQLRERARMGLGLTTVAIGLFAVVDLLFRPELLTLFAIAGLQVALVVGAYLVLQRCTTWGQTVGLLLGLMAVLFATGIASDMVSGTFEATALISLVACLVTAALLPWGVGPQIVLTLLTVATNVASLLLVRGDVDDLGHLVATAAVLLIGAIFAAGASERARRRRFLADAALDAARRRAEDEAAVSAALLEVSQSLAANLGQPDMLRPAHEVALKVLGCDWSSTFELDERREMVRMVAAAGSRPETHDAIAAMEFPVGGLQAAAAAFPDDCIEIASPEAQAFLDPALLRAIDVASAMCVPIAVGGRIVGMQAHGYRTRTGAFTLLQRRLAVGIAQATALALANARLVSDLQSASRLKTEFVATMSHELRTPLNVIMGYADMLLEEAFGTLAPPQHETLARVARSAEELLELVNATLDVGRLESGREPVERAPVDVAGICGELDRELRPLVAEETTLVWRHGGLPAVLADRTKLKTILRNLVGNALKFTRAGRVEVDVAWDDGVLVLRVTDTGIGIAADQLPHVFEMFRQADGSSTRRFGGVGLGLHIVRRLADLLGGSIDATSTLGVGSTFTVRLPAPPAGLRATGS